MFITLFYFAICLQDLDNLCEVLDAANHMQIQTAVELCSDFLISQITFANAEHLLPIASVYNLQRVSVHYRRQVMTHFRTFCTCPQFLQLSFPDLVNYLRSDELVVASEVHLYDAVITWFLADQTRREHLGDLLMQIRFPLMSQQQLVRLQQTANFQEAAKCVSLGLEYHRKCAVGYPILDASAKVRNGGGGQKKDSSGTFL